MSLVNTNTRLSLTMCKISVTDLCLSNIPGIRTYGHPPMFPYGVFLMQLSM